MKLVVIGAQWGDEGKGKLVDFLAEGAEIVVRYSGGANAGHTVVIEGETYKFHLVPSGVLTPGKESILGIGMVVDLEVLFQELELLDEKGIQWRGRLFVADRAHLVLPRYKEMDLRRDRERKTPLGTTGRGIGIAYAEKAYRTGVRLVDLFDPPVWDGLEAADRRFLEPYREPLREMMVDLPLHLAENAGRNVLFEGAQGTLLDLDLGTYPYVSSGMSCAAGAAVGAGIGPTAIDRVLGVFKAYSTRVGNGPFPSEFTPERDGDLGERVREIGREYGVTTGRPRRCGYLDLVALRYACRSNGIAALALTHPDVYDGMEEIKACVAYRIDGAAVDDFPASAGDLERAEPVLRSFPGWRQAIKGCRTFGELPEAARRYIGSIEEHVGVPVSIVSVGYNRHETIVRQDPWTPS